MKSFFWCLLAVLVCGTASVAHSQSDASISVTIPPPYTGDLSVWRSDPNRILIVVRNNTNHPISTRISGYTENSDRSVHIETKDNFPVPRIDLNAFEVRTLNGRDLSLTDVNAVRYSGTSSSTIARTGQLPEGNYSLCLHLLDYNNITTVLSPENCATFNITYLAPPQLINPSCDATIETTTPQSINFSWILPGGATALQSRLQIIELTGGRSAASLFSTSAAIPIYDQTFSGSSRLYGPSDPALTPGHRYGWRVQAIDPSHTAIFQNNGYSTPCEFAFGTGSSTSGGSTSGSLTLSPVYPLNLDTIPYLPPHLIVRFGPYSDDIKQMDYTLTVSGSDGSHYTSHRVLDWPHGPRQGQGWPDASYNDRSTYIVVNQDEGSGGGAPTPSPWSSSLRHGVKYTWSVSAQFHVLTNTVTTTTPPQDFFIGVPPPPLSSPSDRAEIAQSAQPVTLRWKETRPHQLNPPDILGMGSGGSSSLFFGLTDENYRVQLSKTSSFVSIDTSFTDTIESYHTGDNCDALYATHDHILARLDTGWRYWRVQWLAGGSVYASSPVWSFHIGSGTTTSTDTSHHTADSGACVDVCSVPGTRGTIPSTRTYAIGDVIHVGRFLMTLTSVSGSASSLTGEGTISMSFIRAPIMVQFSGIGVNTGDSVFSGEVTAKQAPGSPLSPTVANALGSALGLDTNQIRTIQTFASQSANLVSALTGAAPVGLPIGLDNTIDGEREVIGIIGMVFKPSDARLNAVMSFDIPDMGPGVGIGLGARDICFTPGGFGGDGKVTLYLATDLGYRNPGSWGFVFKAPSSADSGTYLQFDCHGFLELRLAADAEFPRDWLKPDPDDGSSLAKAHFRCTIRKSGDWIASAGLDKCTITGADGFGLEVLEMSYDHSDIRNPTGIVFPSRYVGVHDNTWQGFYIKRAALRLPDALRTFDSSRPPTLAVTNMLINRDGFTASFRAENVIQYPRGNFGEWGASIDTIFVNVVSSSLDSGGINGRIKIPITDSSLIYTASLSRAPSGHLAFNFNIHPTDTINAPLWIARMYLEPTSHIDLTVGDSGFVASATLNGGFRFGGTSEVPVSLGGVHFANFQVMSSSPYLNLGTWSFASPQHALFAEIIDDSPDPQAPIPNPEPDEGTAGGFPLSIHDINIVTGDRGGSPGFGLQFTISVNLMGGSGGISGGTQLSIWGKLASSGGGQNFEFDGVQLDSVGIHGEIASILTVDGSLVLYHHDATYGDGFRAAIHANFLRQLDVTAAAQFGTVNGYRYWFVDAKAVMATGIPIFTGVGIYGFGGGVWSNMRMVSSIATPTIDPSGNITTAAPTPGATNSGLRFVPDNTICFGFRAGVVIGTHPTSMPMNADVYFDASFLCSGGINDIGITGDGYMMAEVNDRSSAKVTMHVEIRYNFPDQRFQGLFTVAINADPFTGGGQLSIYADPHLWYIHIGEPTPVSSQVHLSLADWLTIRAYVLIGQNLPSPPPLPPEIEAILGPMPMTRNPALAHGDGFAFGASADINFRGEFLIFYAQLRVMFGFDLALLNFGPTATCEGISGTMGMNGWYAMGQLYAYIAASVGLHIDVFFWEGDMEILSVALAAALQGGAPNPTWLKGAVGGHYSVLGGAVEGNCRFEFKMGSQCVPITESPLANIQLINQLDPADGSRDVDVYTHPSAAIQFAIDQPFELTEVDGEGHERVRTFRIKVRSCTLQQTDSRANVSGHWIKQEDAHIVEYIPDNLLNGRTRHTFNITVYGEEYISYRWADAHRRDGGSIDQSASAIWTSGEEPDRLDARNINYTYPLDRQRYFLKNECSNGMVQLVQGVRRPFAATTNPAKRSVWKARFIETKAQSERVEADLTFTRDGSGGVRYAAFTLPTLKNSTAYCIQLIRREEDRSSTSTRIRADVSTTSTSASTATMRVSSVAFTSLYSRLSNTVGVNKRQLPGPNVAANEQLLYFYYFNSSKYNRLSDKFAQVELASVDTGSRATVFQRVRLRFNSDELLDVYDMQGYSYKDRDGRAHQSRPLIEPSARVFNKPWHTRYANPYIYDVVRNFGTVTVSMMGGLITQRYSFTPSSFAVLNYGNSLASYVGTPQPLMSDAEMMPPGPIIGAMFGHSMLGLGLTGARGSGISSTTLGSMGSSGGSGVMMSSSSAALTSQIVVSFDQSLAVPGDQLLLQIQAAPILWMASGAMSSAQRTSLTNALSHPYEFVYDGTYPIDFSYWFCQAPDSPMPHVTKEFRKGREAVHFDPPRTVLIRR